MIYTDHQINEGEFELRWVPLRRTLEGRYSFWPNIQTGYIFGNDSYPGSLHINEIFPCVTPSCIQVCHEGNSYNVDPFIHPLMFQTTPSPAGALLNWLTATFCLQLSVTMSPPPPLSPAGTLIDGEPKNISLTRKLVLLVMFCLAQFLDAFNISALFSAIPALQISMGMTQSQSIWVISAFQLTFASFLLIVRAHPFNSDLHFNIFLEWPY